MFLNLKYNRGVIANIHVSWLDPQKIRKITVVGSKKMVIYNDLDDNKIAIYDKGIDRVAILGEQMDFDDPTTFDFDHRSGDVVHPSIDCREPLAIETDHFLDCVINGTQCISGWQHAIGVVDILEKSLCDV